MVIHDKNDDQKNKENGPKDNNTFVDLNNTFIT